jgi:glycosyltransferase involved in cell wall biosynthesis
MWGVISFLVIISGLLTVLPDFFFSSFLELTVKHPEVVGLDLRGYFGVNLYGWISGDFGGGTTARCLLQALLSRNISVSSISISGAELHSHSNTMIFETDIPKNPQNFLIDILAINAANTPTVLGDPKNHIYNNHYRIGVWHWETSFLPIEQGLMGGYYDEIWAPSNYVANAIESTPSFPRSVRVQVIPYGYDVLPPSALLPNDARSRLREMIPVDTDTGNKCSRCSRNALTNLEKWSEDSSLTLFLLIFDFNSDFVRKNVLGAIEAFVKAFPNAGHSAHTGLLIKSSHGSQQLGDYSTVLWHVDDCERDRGSRERVVLMDGVLPSSALASLKQAASCYISLHRSEGWGLNLMESVLMGVPVLATAFGGSEQFMRPLYEPSVSDLRVPYKITNVSECALLAFSQNFSCFSLGISGIWPVFHLYAVG